MLYRYSRITFYAQKNMSHLSNKKALKRIVEVKSLEEINKTYCLGS
jgi:hypothetical protein